MKLFLSGLLAAILLIGAGCHATKKIISHEHTDSSWVTQRTLDIDVKGGTTPSANMDSLREVIRALAARSAGKITVLHDTTAGATDTLKIIDHTGRAELRMWMDGAGKMYADCSAKDVTIQALVNENNRLVRDSKSTIKTVYRLPPWFWGLLASVVIVVILSVVFAAWKRTPAGAATGIVRKNY